jgi:nucleoside-diphosphate-sugar epimerase
MVQLISQYYGVNARFIGFPKGLVFWLGDVTERIFRPFGIEPPIYRRRLAFYTKDRSFDTSKLRNLLEFTPKHSDQAGLAELAEWYLGQGWLKPVKPTV